MVTEDYVSFETAKLLKEKGFDEECLDWYSTKGDLYHYADSFEIDLDGITVLCSAPTLQMAMKWLREEYKIIITIDYDDGSDCEDNERYGFSVYYPSRKVDLATYVTYEEAVEAAIKYSLENLI